MRSPPTVCSITFVRADPIEELGGLHGWACALVNRVRMCRLAIRRTLANQYVVTFPTTVDSAGREHTTVLPIDPNERRYIQRAILAELRRRGDLR